MPILERFFGPTRDEIWEQLAEEIGGNFSAAKDSGWYSKDFPDGIGELLFQVRGEIKDLARLKELYALFGETLDQLCRIGAATHDDPGLVI
jgi:hypothetical protein